MPNLNRSAVALRVTGDSLDPEEITTLLGCQPTTSYRKGDAVEGSKTGRAYIKKLGTWVLEVSDRTPENLEGQISELLGGLTNDLLVWSRLKNSFEIDLYCGLFMKTSNNGTTISADVLRRLGERGIELSIEIYSPTSE